MEPRKQHRRADRGLGEYLPVLRISSALSAALEARSLWATLAAALISAAFLAANASLAFIFSVAWASIFSTFTCKVRFMLEFQCVSEEFNAAVSL